MHTVIKGFVKFLLFIISLLVLICLAVVIYLSNPKLLNSTLPFLLATTDIHYEHRWPSEDPLHDIESRETHPVPHGTLVYVQALDAEEFATRYQLPMMSINETYQYLTEQGYQLKNHWDARQNMFAEAAPYEAGSPSFSQPILFGTQLMFIEQFPNDCLDLLISKQQWFNYVLVLEFAACHE